MQTPFILTDMSNEDYHAADGVSSSQLKTILNKTPAHLQGEVRKPKTHFDVGDAIHTAILEPIHFSTRFVRGPVDRRGNKWTEAKEAAQAEAKILLTEDDYDMAIRVQTAILSKPHLAKYIKANNAVAEQSAFWIDDDTGLLCKVRPDLWIADDDVSGVMIDVKSTVDASPRAFQRACFNYGYHLSAAYYVDGWEDAMGGLVNKFMILAVEKDPPFEAALYALDPDFMQAGREAYRKALDIYADCSLTGKWYGYPHGASLLELPRWAA